MDGSRARRRTVVAALATATLACLALTPGALAQSAGDDQYADPLAGGQQEPRRAPSTEGSDGGQPSAPAPPPAAPGAPDTGTSSGVPAAEPSTVATGESLPRTGARPLATALAGLLLLAAGVGARARAPGASR